MIETLKQTESTPAVRPIVPEYVGGIEIAPEDVQIEPEVVWQRIEAHIAHRWGERQVVWIVEGEGVWTLPLTPTVVDTVEAWGGTAWATYADATPTPLGGLSFPGSGQFRISATVGYAEAPPWAVIEAFRRLAEYSRGIGEAFKGDQGMIQSGEGDTWATSWAGRALQLSGAADLLRPYRRA